MKKFQEKFIESTTNGFFNSVRLLDCSSTIKCYLLMLCIQEGYSGVTRHSNKEFYATIALEMFKYRKSFPKFQDVCTKDRFKQ